MGVYVHESECMRVYICTCVCTVLMFKKKSVCVSHLVSSSRGCHRATHHGLTRLLRRSGKGSEGRDGMPRAEAIEIIAQLRKLTRRAPKEPVCSPLTWHGHQLIFLFLFLHVLYEFLMVTAQLPSPDKRACGLFLFKGTSMTYYTVIEGRKIFIRAVLLSLSRLRLNEVSVYGISVRSYIKIHTKFSF